MEGFRKPWDIELLKTEQDEQLDGKMGERTDISQKKCKLKAYSATS